MTSATDGFGLSVLEIERARDLPETLASESLAALIIGSETSDLGKLMISLRLDEALASVPTILYMSTLDAKQLKSAYRQGVDDYLIDGAKEQFTALMATLKNENPWSTGAAPAGRIILAHHDRMERVKLSRVLRRNGFDVFFVSSMEELENALEEEMPRAVVTSSQLPGPSIGEIVDAHGGETLPLVLLTSDDPEKRLPASVLNRPKTALLESGSDVSGLTFIINELCAPQRPKGFRKSARLLYGTPVSFVHGDGETAFYGFTYNISIDGVYIRTLTPLPVPSRMDISFKPPFGTRRIIANAQVAWVKLFGQEDGPISPPGMGVQFTSMMDDDRADHESGYKWLLIKRKHKPVHSLDPGSAV